jgi:hypothetical protein
MLAFGNSDLLRCDTTWLRQCFDRAEWVHLQRVKCPKIALNPESGRHIPKEPNPQQHFHAVIYPSLVFGVCVYYLLFYPLFSQLLILYSHLSTNRMDGGRGELYWCGSGQWQVAGSVTHCRQSTVGVHKVLDTPGPAENLSAFQERLCSMDLVSWLVSYLVS